MTHSTNQEAELRAKWEHLTLANDRMFGMVMEDDQICLELLHRIFPRLDIKHIQRVTTQKQVNTTLGIKAPRFDAYVRDDQNRTYILEMQVKNNHNLPFRMRYYMNHADVLRPGDSYDEQHVNPIYVIFFCDFDYYGDGAMAYEFEMRSVRNPARSAEIGLHLVVFNAKAQDFHDKIKLAGFLRLMHNERTPGDALAERIYEKMEQVKHDPERWQNFMKYELDLMDARNEGLEQGIEQGRDEQQAKDIILMVKILKNNQISDEQIERDLMSNYGLSRQEAQKYMK